LADPNIKTLSIQVQLNGLSFCVKDQHTNAVIYLKSIDFNHKVSPIDLLNALKEEFSAHSIYAEDFEDVTIIHQNELNAIVPKELYDEQNKADYLKFNAKILRTDFIAADDINGINSVNVYVPYVNINNYIFDTFGSFTYKHASTVLIDTLSKYARSSDSQMYVHLNKESFELLVYKKKELLLYNYFEYTCPEDFIYYILFVFEQLGLDVETTQIHVVGRITDEDPNFRILYTYVRHVALLDIDSDTTFFKNLEPTDISQHFLILNSFE
jgi:hypothetical protein